MSALFDNRFIEQEISCQSSFVTDINLTKYFLLPLLHLHADHSGNAYSWESTHRLHLAKHTVDSTRPRLASMNCFAVRRRYMNMLQLSYFALWFK